MIRARYRNAGFAAGTALILATSIVVQPIAAVGASPRVRTGRATGQAAGLATVPKAGQQGKEASEEVILLLRASCSSRSRTTAGVACAAQAPVLAQLKADGARVVSTTTLVDSITALVSPTLAKALGSSGAISQVVPDAVLTLGPAGSAALATATSAAATSAGAVAAKSTAAVAPAKSAAAISAAATSDSAAQAVQRGVGRAVPQPAAPARSGNKTAQAVLQAHTVSSASDICGTRSQPELDPEALQDIYANQARAMGIDGSGVTVAVLADGLDPDNPDFVRNGAYGTAGTPVISKYLDFSGDGTAAKTDAAEAFGDASSIAAQGNTAYNISQYVNPDVASTFPPSGCWVKIVGVSPGASLLVLKVIGNASGAATSSLVQAVQYAVQHGAKVINESLGSGNFPDTALDVLRDVDDAAVAAGVTVVTSSGDAGLTSTIGSPATDPNLISVGATTNFRNYAQADLGGFDNPVVGNGTWVSNNIASFSSGGFTQSGGTVDLVAPGDSNWALCSTDFKVYTGCADTFKGTDIGIQSFGGTSEASPLTAGAAADVIQAYAKTHGGASPSPALVKQILSSTATDIDAPADEQGAGMLNVLGAVKLAESLPAPVTPTPTTTPGTTGITATTSTTVAASATAASKTASPASKTATARLTTAVVRGAALRLPADETAFDAPSGSLLVSPNQFDVLGTPGTRTNEQLSLTNTSSAAIAVQLSTRALADKVYDSGVQDFVIDPSVTTTNTGTFPIWSGVPEVFQTETFKVPASSNSRLVFTEDYPDTKQSSVLHVALYEPNGTYAGYSDPQGLGDYGEVEVANPPAGKWTALFFTEQSGATKGATGTSGTVQWDASTWTYAAAAALHPSSLTIAPGQTATATMSIRNPQLAGDSDESVVVSSPDGRTTVPVIVRTAVHMTAHGGTFEGVLTGGNGRDGSEAQTNTYFFQVPPGETDLNATISLSSDSDEHLVGYLVSPAGEPLAYSGNYTLVPSGSSAQPKATYHLVPGDTAYVQMYAVAPQAGEWEVVLQWVNPVTGNELTEPFSGSVQFNEAEASGKSLPDSPSVQLGKGVENLFQVDVANLGVAPEAYFVDPRLNTTARVTLPDLNPRNIADLLELPLGSGLSFPLYLVPTGTTEVNASILHLAGTGSVTFDFNHLIGDPDLSPEVPVPGVTASTGPGTQSVSLSAPEVTPGLWALNAQEVGPYPAHGAPKEVAVATVTAVTQAFDTSVRSDTDDLWQAGLNFSHFHYLGPGQSVAIPIAIKPTAPVGTRVTGTLYIDDFTLDSFLSSGDLLPNADEVAAVPYSYTVVTP